MTSTISCVIHHWFVSVMWDLRGVQFCCAVSGLLGCEVMSLGKWFSVFSRQYSPLKQWNHLPSDIASFSRRPEHLCLKESGGFVKKQMVLQFLTIFYSCRSNQYQCNTPPTMITEGLLQFTTLLTMITEGLLQFTTLLTMFNSLQLFKHCGSYSALHQRKKMKM
jgi:hypothetical protein